jgi:hypothetical protein
MNLLLLVYPPRIFRIVINFTFNYQVLVGNMMKAYQAKNSFGDMSNKVKFSRIPQIPLRSHKNRNFYSWFILPTKTHFHSFLTIYLVPEKNLGSVASQRNHDQGTWWCGYRWILWFLKWATVQEQTLVTWVG